jgi:hypothetical protein
MLLLLINRSGNYFVGGCHFLSLTEVMMSCRRLSFFEFNRSDDEFVGGCHSVVSISRILAFKGFRSMVACCIHNHSSACFYYLNATTLSLPIVMHTAYVPLHSLTLDYWIFLENSKFSTGQEIPRSTLYFLRIRGLGHSLLRALSFSYL